MSFPEKTTGLDLATAMGESLSNGFYIRKAIDKTLFLVTSDGKIYKVQGFNVFGDLFFLDYLDVVYNEWMLVHPVDVDWEDYEDFLKS